MNTKCMVYMLEHLVVECKTFLLQLLVYSQPSPVAVHVKSSTCFVTCQNGHGLQIDRKEIKSNESKNEVAFQIQSFITAIVK